MQTFPEVWVLAVLVIVASIAFAVRFSTRGTPKIVALTIVGLAAQFGAWRIYEVGDQWPWTVAAMQFCVAVLVNVPVSLAAMGRVQQLRSGEASFAVRPAFLPAWSLFMWSSIFGTLPLIVIFRAKMGNDIWGIGVPLLFLPGIVAINRMAFETVSAFIRGGPANSA